MQQRCLQSFSLIGNDDVPSCTVTGRGGPRVPSCGRLDRSAPSPQDDPGAGHRFGSSFPRHAAELGLSLNLTTQVVLLERTGSRPSATSPEGANLGRRRSRDLLLAVRSRGTRFPGADWLETIRYVGPRLSANGRTFPDNSPQTSAPARIAYKPAATIQPAANPLLRPRQLSPPPVVSSVDNRLRRPPARPERGP